MLHDNWQPASTRRQPADQRQQLERMDDPIRVLLIDDDPDALALLKTRLESTGRFSVATATSGSEGLDLARDLEPHIIVCDIYMPGMGGADVAAALAGDDVLMHVPLLFLSALVKADEIRANGGRIGGWPMASKEEPMPSIVRRMDQLLHRSRR
jgi:two-component system OmpR family response regulator